MKVLLRSFCFLAILLSIVPTVSASDEKEKIRKIILSTEHLGAHGMGYNTQSVRQMSEKLTPKDIPTLLELYKEPLKHEELERNVHVGAQFALASLCEPGLQAVTNAVHDGVMNWIE